MKLSTRGDYATRALVELAALPEDGSLTLGQLAGRTGVPRRYLEQLLLRLRAGDVVRTRRGPAGGYQLARPAAELTVGSVIRLMDGPLAPSLCASRTRHEPCPAYRCPDEEACALRDLWLEVRNAISDIVDHTTFADLAGRSQERRVAAAPRYQI